jgi:hypothetical protein
VILRRIYREISASQLGAVGEFPKHRTSEADSQVGAVVLTLPCQKRKISAVSLKTNPRILEEQFQKTSPPAKDDLCGAFAERIQSKNLNHQIIRSRICV